MSGPERAGGTKTQRERKAIQFLEELRLLTDTAQRRDAVMRVFGEEYQRGFAEAWEECSAESVAPAPPVEPRKKFKVVRG